MIFRPYYQSHSFRRHHFRYIDTMTRRVKSGVIGKHAPSLSVIKGIWYRLIRFLQFYHQDLNDHYEKLEQMRISTHLDQLVKRGLSVKGKWFKKLWLGFLVLKKLVACWIETALANGCLSWDRVLRSHLVLFCKVRWHPELATSPDQCYI